MSVQMISLENLVSHPANPRFSPRQDVIDGIVAQLQQSGRFDEAYSLLVRPLDDKYQIISGHQRLAAAQIAGITELPCWVREMGDEEAYMALALSNTQGELHPLEEGMHALQSGFSGSEYARRVGKPQTTIAYRFNAARVADGVISHEITSSNFTDLSSSWRQLAEIHVASEWLWRALAQKLLADGWTVEATRNEVKKFKDCGIPPEWTDQEAVAAGLVEGKIRVGDIGKFEQIAERSKAALHSGKEDADRFCDELDALLKKKRPARLSDVTEYCNRVEQEQAELIRQSKQADLFRQRAQEEVAARIARLRRYVTLDEWKDLGEEEKAQLLSLPLSEVHPTSFNKQDSSAIEWAQFSWNPVTGCLHNCPYCYARDIAESSKMSKVYPAGFAPAIRPEMLLAPNHMTVPKQAASDTRYRNVFTCSMADLFGRWVPSEWVEAVFREIRKAKDWNFLCLTKFPKRLAEFDIPDNAWMGTTVDLQARVKPAEEAFANVNAGVKWLSIEPLLEPLKFSHMERFDWVVIGGASRSSQTPEWHPPFPWIHDIVQQAKDAGCSVYFKTNLLGKRLLELPFSAPIQDELGASPEVFHYLTAPDKSKSEKA